MAVALESAVTRTFQNAARCERCTVYRGLAELSPAYEALFAENAAESFFLSLPWFRNFCAAALDPGDDVHVFGAENAGGAPVAALVTRSPRGGSWRMAPRTLHGLTNFYTSLYAPLLSGGDIGAALGAVARAIAADTPRWDAVDLKWLDSGSLVFAELQRAFRAAGFVVQAYFSSGNWYLPSQGMSFQQYWDGLRSSVRNIAKSKNRKVERSGRAALEIVTGGSGLEDAITAYQQVYSASWKVAEPYPDFIPALIRTCAAQGWLRLGLVRVDGEPAAAQLWIVSHGKAAIYKIAYDKRFADLSVGSFLTTRMMQHVLDVDHVREVDYLTGDDKYKQDWMTHRRERWGILAMNPRTPRGALAIARHVGGRAAKRALQAVLRAVRKPAAAPGTGGPAASAK
ncbi:MAG TPA: GNAT family N-acetyltransferase [Methylomirabilota bacterium]|nr:GNAT family N-acetyltransferase [Methylomirabilota bacterium]